MLTIPGFNTFNTLNSVERSQFWDDVRFEISGLVAGGDLYRQMKQNVVHPHVCPEYTSTSLLEFRVFGRCLTFWVDVCCSSVCSGLFTLTSRLSAVNWSFYYCAL